MMKKDSNGILLPGKINQEAAKNSQQADGQKNNVAFNKKEKEDNEEIIEVDEFGRMLRRDSRQRDDEYDYSDNSDNDRSRSRRRSSSNRSSRHRYLDDYYEPKTNHYYRKHQLDRYVPRHSRYSDSDREENSRSIGLRREKKRSRACSRRSSDSDYDDDRRSSRRRFRSREESSEHKRRRSQSDLDPYLAASEYIDTEFYSKKVFVGELRNVSERALYNAFERFGDIENIDWLPEKGIAFIDFDTEENAAEARRKMNSTLLGSNYIQVNRAKRPERNINGFGNVPWSDADGAEARKNEKRNQHMHNIFSPGPTAQNVVTPATLDPRAQIPKRKIIAYDDL